VEDLAGTLVTLGLLLLVGLATDAVGRRTALPRVTLLLVFGLGIGPSGLDLLPDAHERWFPLFTHVALGMVGFLLGDSLSAANLRRHGREVISVSLAAVLTTAAIVGVGMLALGQPVAVALVFGGIATSTAPAATLDVIREARGRGPFTDTLRGVVAVDDAFGLIVFSLALAAAQWFDGNGDGLALLGHHFQEIGGAILVGALLGLPLATLSGRVRPGEPSLMEALGGVLLCSGICAFLEVSYLIGCMTLGAIVANLASHHTRPFHAIENVEGPFLILFFVLAGAALHLDALWIVGGALPVYVILRALGRLAGGWLGGLAAGWSERRRGCMGLALMPQAGVALGMTLVACERLPELTDIVLPVAIASTVAFELGGPVLTRLALVLVGEAEPGSAPPAVDDRDPA
jgi:Kef-type K+ transport system membrane component KefB